MNPDDLKIVLGSASVNRRQLMRELRLPFKTIEPNIDEKAIRSDDPAKLCMTLARAKNEALKVKVDNSTILITADQVVLCNGQIREKPANKEEAREFLKSYARYPAMTYSAVAVLNTSNNLFAEGIDFASVTFKEIPDDVIDEFIEKGSGFKNAGGFSIEDKLLAPYIKDIDGAPDSVLGLPQSLLWELMEAVGY